MTTYEGAPPGARPDGAGATERPDQAATSSATIQVPPENVWYTRAVEWLDKAEAIYQSDRAGEYGDSVAAAAKIAEVCILLGDRAGGRRG